MLNIEDKDDPVRVEFNSLKLSVRPLKLGSDPVSADGPGVIGAADILEDEAKDRVNCDREGSDLRDCFSDIIAVGFNGMVGESV